MQSIFDACQRSTLNLQHTVIPETVLVNAAAAHSEAHPDKWGMLPVMPFAAGNGVWRLVAAMLLIAAAALILDWRARR